MTPEQVAWLAGLFEGEGCLSRVSGRKNYQRGYWAIRINMTDRDVVETAYNLTGKGTIKYDYLPPKLVGKQKPYTIWSVGAQAEVHEIVTAIYPWLHGRRKARADEFFEDYARGRGKLCYSRRHEIPDGKKRCPECYREWRAKRNAA